MPTIGHADLLEHLEALARIDQRDVLRRGHDHRAGHRHLLRERQLDVAGAGRHVDDEVVDLAPVRVLQQLLERLRDHRAAPDHRRVLVDHEADRHRLHAVRLHRLERLAVVGLRAAGDAEHRRLRRPVDVGVEDADGGAFRRQREREVHRGGGLAHAALAARHGDDVLHAGHELHAALHRMRHDLRADRRRSRVPAPGSARTASLHERLHRLVLALRRDSRAAVRPRRRCPLTATFFTALPVTKSLPVLGSTTVARTSVRRLRSWRETPWKDARGQREARRPERHLQASDSSRFHARPKAARALLARIDVTPVAARSFDVRLPAPRKLFVTTALPYANGPFHIGHIMEYIQADIWVRFQRMQGHEVHFVCADDAHGAPIMLKAEERRHHAARR